METSSNWLIWTLAVIVGVLVLVIWQIMRKNRPRQGDHVFLASRLTAGNRVFPAQVIVTSSSVTMVKPQFIGRVEESLHINHVASIKIDTNMMFSDIVIETTGGRQPVILHGHTKGDAIAIKKVIEEYQTAYYKKNQA